MLAPIARSPPTPCSISSTCSSSLLNPLISRCYLACPSTCSTLHTPHAPHPNPITRVPGHASYRYALASRRPSTCACTIVAASPPISISLVPGHQW
jgi:hypothetical protein